MATMSHRQDEMVRTGVLLLILLLAQHLRVIRSTIRSEILSNYPSLVTVPGILGTILVRVAMGIIGRLL